jgi:transcriptional regulator with PAS, ATPase and Fis domain
VQVGSSQDLSRESMPTYNIMNSDQIFNHKLLDILFDNANYGTIIVDNNGKIQYMSKNYCAFLKMDREYLIGKYVVDIIENTRMHLVVQTGVSEMADIQFLRGYFVITNRVPIFENEKIIGAIGTIIYKDIDDWKQTNSNIKENLTINNFFHEEIDENNGLRYSLNNLIGNTKEVQLLKEDVKKVAIGDISILIRGESGTGKEIVAQGIHHLSQRSNKPFVKVNCGAIPEHLIESELFGYVEGSFTGAKKGGKIGKFQIANEGTIFLDEIGDMPLHMQVKLLRVLQEKEFEPVGSLKPIKVNVRVIAATNRPLETMIEKREFREDLYYRINAVQLFTPPLRNRIDDVPLLMDHFLKMITSRIGKRITSIDPDVKTLLMQYEWPGNIRELENVIEAGVHLSNDVVMGLDALPEYLKRQKDISPGRSLKDIVEITEKKTIESTLKKYNFDKNKAAKSLGLANSTIYEKIKKYKISTPLN